MSGVKGSKNVMPYAGGLKIEINPDKYSQAFELVDIIGHRPFIAGKSQDSGIFIDNYSMKNDVDEIKFIFSVNVKKDYIKFISLTESSETTNN